MSKMIWTKRNWQQFDTFHEQYGRTFGMYYCDKPHVSTVDLGLIKAIVLDKPDDHLKLPDLNTPLDQFEKENIMTCSEEQWRRLRNAIAPGFT